MNRGLALAGAVGLGAGLIYLADPQQGRRRRALLRDQALKAWRSLGGALAPLATCLTRPMALEAQRGEPRASRAPVPGPDVLYRPLDGATEILEDEEVAPWRGV
jgi:hypothetical protein